jgi:N-methylhydantoinase A/oxoprolinase/acetone carboxylase beta subunit
LSERRFRIAVDIGGTFTDCVVLEDGGRTLTTKVLTTPDDPAEGVVHSVAQSAAALGIEVGALLRGTVAFVHGTTIGTNTLVQRRGARTGLLMTRGHEQTITIGRVRQKVTGLSEREKIHLTHLHKADPPLVPPEDVRGVTERLDASGRVIVALDRAETVRAIDDLVASGVEALAVCLLWSFVDPSHERWIGEHVRARHPALYVSLSSEVAPLLGEYERCVSTVFNSYIGPVVGEYLARLEARLAALGMTCSLLVMQSNGGVSPVEAVRRRPILTLDSGPAGGVLGGKYLAGLLGIRNVVCADVGGTTFDVGLVFADHVQMDPRPVLDRYAYLVPKIYVKSIGAGGGSVAWVDDGGTLRVGPRSAGSNPGPVAYGRGGSEPTVTDAHLALGYLDPAFPLGGQVRIDRSAAEVALAALGRRLGMSATEVAAAIVEISSAQMADLMRKVTVERGLDPREFAVFAYGGAGPVYAAFLAREIGARTAYVPDASGVFAALGMLTTDLVFQEERSMLQRPPLDAGGVVAVNALYGELEAGVLAAFAREGFAAGRVQLERSVDMRFTMQVHELDVEIPGRTIESKDIDAVMGAFVEKYEQTYGKNSAYTAAGVEMVTFRAVGTVRLERPPLPSAGEDRGGARSLLGSRPAYFASVRDWVETEVHAGDRVAPGAAFHGPAIIQRMGDTVVIPPGAQARMDRRRNLIVEWRDGRDA